MADGGSGGGTLGLAADDDDDDMPPILLPCGIGSATSRPARWHQLLVF